MDSKGVTTPKGAISIVVTQWRQDPEGCGSLPEPDSGAFLSCVGLGFCRRDRQLSKEKSGRSRIEPATFRTASERLDH